MLATDPIYCVDGCGRAGLTMTTTTSSNVAATLLRLPTGIFYAQGVKANVIFFERKPGAKELWTKKVWIYDCRTNKEFTLKERRMVRADLDEFVECYHPENRHQRKPTWNEKKNPEGRC